jgi:NAD(P)-dependent dehydrogenase (short-subunit alcohol dehydrogenase family)
VALVTGAATGIGAATADLLEERGYAVARNHLPGQRVTGYSAEADVSDPAAVGRMVQSVTRDLGPVDVLVNNAAHMVMGGS